MKLKLKVCGMRDSSNIMTVSALHPDYLGFIYYERSPRYVGNNFQLPEMDNNISRVGVFVNQIKSYILDKVKENELNAVQLHGNESPELCGELKSSGLQILKAFSIDSQFDFSSTQPYLSSVDFFLFDTKGKNYGGTGRTFDWSILEQYIFSTPFFLSGGLSEENLSDVALIKNPSFYGVDLNSGYEEAPGLKNKNKIEAAIKLLNIIN